MWEIYLFEPTACNIGAYKKKGFKDSRVNRFHYIKLFKEIFSHPKLEVFRCVYGYGLGDTKSVDTPVSYEIGFVFTIRKRVNQPFHPLPPHQI